MSNLKYPIVLVHMVLAGFNEIRCWFSLSYFYGIADALLRQDVWHPKFLPTSLSAFNSNEVRGKSSCVSNLSRTLLQGDTSEKVNFIGHSQGPLACRYVCG